MRGYAVTHPRGLDALPPADGWDQLVYATAGVMTVHTDVGTWVVPPDRAVWVPDGTSRRITLTGPTRIRTLYYRAGAAPGSRCRAIAVSPLLRELIAHTVPRCPLWHTDPHHERLAGLVLDLLADAPEIPLRLPLPADPRARAVAAAIAREPASDPAASALSRRSLERIFRAETGLTLGQYRERARLLAALPRLAAGEPVARVAADVGYATPSAFGVMFKRVLGTSPARYFSGR
ncbi:AraC family transcriptional regulator [Virgisporangium aliadipatigenens]|uniref:AraC family transcriptional regulator n=1 Tax=Virgisporangium aliadipatigenens TaxID=741659 RepID=A0A8J3YL24_9ACTN|nr:AraC family transcriptional regulator [Virgisporangium aliadipatigenens]